jgi:hypothetical protein
VRHVTIESSAGPKVAMQFHQRRSRVSPMTGTLTQQSQSPHVLKLDGDDAQFVKRIELRTAATGSGNPNWSCDFASRGEFRELELSDD